jgi:selenocysteine lyase/cysteine desulfurase
MRLVADAITSKTRIVALSHIQFTCGLKLPVKEIAGMAHAAGVPILVDGAQTGGAIDIDVNALGADFYSISGQKWVLGPLGTGALYVSPGHNRWIRPLFTTHAIADERASHSEAPGANRPLSRFRVTSNSAALIGGFAEAMRLLRSVGFDAIEARSSELASRMKGGLAEMSGCRLTGPSDDDVSSSLVAVALEGWEPAAIVEQLWERWRIGARAVNNPPAVRFSVAAFNTEEEVDTALEAVKTLVREGPGGQS